MSTENKVRKVTKPINVNLTEDEISEKAKLAGAKGTALRELEADFDRTKKAYKAKIETLRGEIDGLLSVIDAGEEERQAECKEVHDFACNRVVTYYLGSKIDERAMEPHERQESLFPKADSADARAAKKRAKNGEISEDFVDLDDGEPAQGDLPLNEAPTPLEQAANAAIAGGAEGEIERRVEEENKRVVEESMPLRDQVNEEFKEASKIVKGW